MQTVVKKTIKEKEIRREDASEQTKTYADEPFFVNKTEQARQTLLRVGLPSEKKS